MKHPPEGSFIYYEDQLVQRVLFPDKTKVSQGKRVSATCGLTAVERQLYVKGGIIPCVKHVKDRLSCSLQEAMDIFRSARGPRRR